MSIRLVFQGGLFSVMPGVVQPKKVDVHMVEIRPVRVVGNGAGLAPWMAAAVRIDFETAATFDLGRFHLRDIAHLIPVDYRGFERVVSFNGGTVSHEGVPAAGIDLVSIQAAGDQQQQQNAYEDFVGAAHQHDQGEYLQRLLGVFFANKDPEDFRLWKPGYLTVVELHEETWVVCDGKRDQKRSVPDGTRIHFEVGEKSVIPHFPHSNPHVLEQPPTI